MPADVITCPNCGASDIPFRYARDYDACPYCGTTLRVADERPNTTDAYKERIARERAERPPAQAYDEARTLMELSRLKAKAKRVAVWIAALVVAIILTLCTLSLGVSWLKQGEDAAAQTMIGAGIFGGLTVIAWAVEERMRRRARRTRGIF